MVKIKITRHIEFDNALTADEIDEEIRRIILRELMTECPLNLMFKVEVIIN